MIGSLSDIIFVASSERVLTFQNGMTRSRETRIAEHAVIAQKPSSEFQGVGLYSSDLTIVLDAKLGVSPAIEMQKIREYQEDGKICTLIIGEAFFGDYLISSISEQYDQIFKDGAVIKATLNIGLKEYN